MKTIKLSFSIALLTTLILSSCSKDDGDSFTPSASDLITTIDENPTNGTTIGTVATNLTGTLNYSIGSQSVANSFSIDNTTGVVTINDETNFDFETNTVLTATVTVTNSSETATSMVEVTLNNVDDIASFLSTSRADYESASAGEWVIITENEYNVLALSLNQVVKAATDDNVYDMGPNSQAGGAFTLANNNGANMPIGSYLFAVKYNLASSITGATIKIKVSSTSISEDYSDFGNTINGFDAGDNFAVLKSNNNPTPNVGYVSIYDSSGVIGYRNISGNLLQYAGGESNTLSSSQNGGTIFYQVLTTTQKQWD